MDIKDIVSVEEVAKILGYRNSSVALLCRKGKLEGAFRIGHQWMIPRTTIENYEKGPQGFAAIWKRKREAEKAQNEADDVALAESDSKVNSKEELEREILHYMKILSRKIGRLEKLFHREKAIRNLLRHNLFLPCLDSC